jgi:hypothetical protein
LLSAAAGKACCHLDFDGSACIANEATGVFANRLTDICWQCQIFLADIACTLFDTSEVGVERREWQVSRFRRCLYVFEARSSEEVKKIALTAVEECRPFTLMSCRHVAIDEDEQAAEKRGGG